MITMTCQRCGGSIKTADVGEAIEWDSSHDKVCPALVKTDA